ncbi:MAG: hypothetical protein JRN67_09525 [Nitrososphaerota archaeon]|nr:hypothetical protein [Nitrososphaerota archaeon]
MASEPLPSLRSYLDYSNLSFATIPEVVRELEGLAHSREKTTARKARFVLRLIGTTITLIDQRADKNKNVEADIALYECARQMDFLVATMDGRLLSRFERNRLPFLTLREDKPFERSFGRATYLSARKKSI